MLTNSNRRNLHNHKHRHPIPRTRQRHPLRPIPRSVDLTRIEPRHRKPANPQEQLEDEDERHRRISRGERAKGEQDGGHDEAEGQPRGGEHEEGAAAEAVH